MPTLDTTGVAPCRPNRRYDHALGALHLWVGGGGGQRSRSDQPQDAGRVERPRTDDQGVSAEGREQPVIEPTVETTPAPIADAPDSTTTKKQVEDPTKLEDSGKPKAARKKKGDS